MTSRWDYLFDRKPVPLLEHLLEEVSRLLAQDLARWPLPVQALDEEAGRAFAAVAQGDIPRPARALFEEAFRLARWELQHALEAYDDYVRHQRWQDRGLAASDRPALLFVSRWLLEQMTSLREATEGRVTGKDLLDCLNRAEHKLRA